MSATETHTTTPHGAFLRNRLGAILAIAPLGAWTVVHVWNNLAAFRGADAWEQAVTGHAHPIATAFTAIMVLLPLAIHTVWGLARLFHARPNNVRYATYDNLKFLLQRASALGVLLFLGAHLWLATIQPRFVQGHPEHFADIAREMRHHGPTLFVYVLGTLGVAYHLANGIGSFVSMTMGWVPGRAAQRRLDRVVLAFFLVFLAMSWGALYALWRAG